MRQVGAESSDAPGPSSRRNKPKIVVDLRGIRGKERTVSRNVGCSGILTHGKEIDVVHMDYTVVASVATSVRCASLRRSRGHTMVDQTL